MINKYILLLTLGLTMNANALTINSPTDMNSFSPWKDMINTIQASPDRNITILWQGYGGRGDVGDFVRSSLNDLRHTKNLNIVVVGHTYSEHANVLCSFAFKNQSMLQFHLSGQTYTSHPHNGTGDEVSPTTEKNQFEMVDHSESGKGATLGQIQGCINRGILTSDDVRALMDGYTVGIFAGSSYHTHDKDLRE